MPDVHELVAISWLFAWRRDFTLSSRNGSAQLSTKVAIQGHNLVAKDAYELTWCRNLAIPSIKGGCILASH